MKSNFIINELWQLAITGAFQRAGVYKTAADEDLKNQFKSELKADLEGFIQAQYFKPCTEAQHLENILQLSEHTQKYASLLKNGQLTIGVSQKILNLFLKYLWCLKLVPDPPHFPVDRSIQILLNKQAKRLGLATVTIKPWTQLKTIEEYLEIIDLAKRVQAANPNHQRFSLAEFELMLFVQN